MREEAAKLEAKKATGLAVLQRYYDEPTLALNEALAAGQRVVGRTSNTVPVEPIIAAGRTPFLLKPPLGRPTPTADVYLDPILPPRTHAFFEAAVAGDYADLDLLVLGRGDDKLFYYLKEHYRQVGSSRVDLQACKLEYSIVSPK